MITSTSNPRVKQVVQWQTKAKERRCAGVFLTEGFKLFEEAPEEMIREVYVSAECLDKALADPKIGEKLKRTGYETVTEEVFLKMSDTRTPQGILCVIGCPVYAPEQLTEGPAPLLMLLEDIQDPGNLGTILRTGEGAGITGVIMSRQTVDIFNPKTIRATMGSVYRVPFAYADDLGEIIGRIRSGGIRIYAAHLEGKADYDAFDYRGGTAFLIGNEGSGLKRSTARMADEYLKIPMEGKVESLNAAVASALLMYEAHRQRKSGN